MRRQHVGAPQHHELREPERLGIHADAVVAQRVAGAEAAGDRADRLHVTRRAEHVPQPAPGAIGAVDQAHVAGADEGPDRLGAVAWRSRRGAAWRSRRAPRPRRCARTRRGPSARRGAAGTAPGRASARSSGSRRPCCTASRACRGVRDRRAGRRLAVLHGHDPAARVWAVERTGAADLARLRFERRSAIPALLVVIGPAPGRSSSSAADVRISTVVFAIRWLEVSGSACSLPRLEQRRQAGPRTQPHVARSGAAGHHSIPERLTLQRRLAPRRAPPRTPARRRGRAPRS